MFSTMDNTKVYDKQDIDNTLGTPTPGVSGTAFERITNAESRILQNEQAIDTLNRDKATNARVQAIENALEGSGTGLVSRIRATELALETKVNKSYVDNELDTKADKSYVDNKLSTKVNQSAISGMVNSAISAVIDAKVQSITSDILHIVDNAVPTAMTTTEATAIVNTYF